MLRGSLVIGLALLSVQGAWAQMDAPVLTEAEEIALARSAAPDVVSASADVWVLGDAGFYLASRGGSGNACIVNRGWDARELKPTCYDPEAARTVLQRKIREHQLRTEGKTRDEVAEIVGDELNAGTLGTPRRPAMAYMMSSGQRLVIDGEVDDGVWPHVMLYLPHMTAADFGLAENTDELMVIREGTPQAFAIFVLPNAVDPEVLAAN